MKKEEAKKYYRQGLEFFRKENFIEAEKYFTLALEHKDVMEDALSKLIYVYINTGRYAHARRLLNDTTCKNFPSLYQLRGLLDEYECNYHSSLENYNRSRLDISHGRYSMLGIANVNRQLGNYETARTMYEFLMCSPTNYFDGVENLVSLYVGMEKYDEAYRILLEVSQKQMPKEIWERFISLIYFVEQKLGVKNPIMTEDRVKKHYTGLRLLRPSCDKELINHIMKHVEHKKNDVTGVFYEETNFRPILVDVRKKLGTENPTFYNQFQSNIFLMDYTVGKVEGVPTNALKVGTYINTDTILTMYPVLVSDEFDKEKNNTSEELRKKRMKR